MRHRPTTTSLTMIAFSAPSPLSSFTNHVSLSSIFTLHPFLSTRRQTLSVQPSTRSPSSPTVWRRRANTAVLNTLNTSSAEPSPASTSELPYTVHDWTFKSFRVQYATSGVSQTPESFSKPAVVLVHGFGANCQHWRNNLAPLANRGFRVYAMDLLGFGMGEKPPPGLEDSDGQKVEYTFDYWTAQLKSFLDTIVQPPTSDVNTNKDTSTSTPRPVFLVANSIGCMVTMQISIEQPHRVAALTFISPSLRQLNVRKRSNLQDITAPFLMRILSYRPIGAFFLDSLSKPRALRSVLNGAYAVSTAVDDDLIQILSQPAKTPGALDVFLSFISYDTGPIPEDFLPHLAQPALVLWGEEDVFEPFELGQKLRHYSVVESFVPLPETGHCAHDEQPERCNELIGDFLDKHRHRANVST